MVNHLYWKNIFYSQAQMSMYGCSKTGKVCVRCFVIFIFLLHTEKCSSVDICGMVSHFMRNGIHSHSGLGNIRHKLNLIYGIILPDLCQNDDSQSLHNFEILTNTRQVSKSMLIFVLHLACTSLFIWGVHLCMLIT